MPATPNRRRFLQTALFGASTVSSPWPSHAAPPSRRLRLGFIGVGGRGAKNLAEMQVDPDVEVALLCDVNQMNLDRAAMLHPGARTFRDFRRLYEQPLDGIDGIVVSTTEHTHAYATLPALRQRIPVYCEKPLTHNIAEARLITQAAAEAGVATQMGTQIHAMPNYRRVVELIRSGVIGAVSEVHVCVDRAWGLQSATEATDNKDVIHVTERPTEAQPPPPHLDWDLWLGPAPFRPYHESYFPGPKWYRWWDFGNGTMSDLGSHWMDLPYWALELDSPLTVEATGPQPHPEIAPATMSVKYEYAARGNRPACRVHWHQGNTKPNLWTEHPVIQSWNSGVLFIGSKGMLLSDYKKHVLLPEDTFATEPGPVPFLPESPGQHLEWLNAIRNGSPTGSPFSYAGPLTEANHLGNVAFRCGQKISWDATTLSSPDCPAASQYVSRTPRAGWTL